MPPAPSLYSPLVNPEIALQRRSIVLSRMEQEGFITSSEAEEARNSPLALKPAIPKYYNSTAPYFTTWVAQQLPTMLTPEQLEVGGLKIRTSLNLDWQRKAQKVVREIAPNGTEGVIVSIAPGTGLVRVMVGGKNFYSSQFNRATQALRSPGSTFKLFPYSAAINAGVKPEDIFLDKPRCWNGYCPKNFGKKYFGNISLADALKNSLNTVAVQLQDKVGFDPIIAMANNLGIGNKRPLGRYYPMAIGAYEQTVLDMTTAYSAVNNRGVYVKPTAFEEIRGPGGDVLWSRRVDGDRGKRAMDSDVADTMNWMLQRVVSGGTGIAAKLDDRPVAGKTGTSEGGRDIWFIGSIPQLTTAVWFGHDNNAETKSNSGESAWAWKQFMNQIKSEFPAQKFPAKPKTVRPVLQRPGKKKASDPNKPNPGDGPLPDRDLFGETDPSNDNAGAPKPAPTPRYVSPSGGPPVDEFFRPLPVQ
jgi:penicillin-binding protein 1A